jgi:type I restriction enzyme R subunit
MRKRHPVNQTASANFPLLAHHDARLVALCTQAEQHFSADPTITLFKLRQFAEVLAQRAAAKVGVFLGAQETQPQLVDRLFDRNVIAATQRSLSHDLRRVGKR